MKYAQYDTATGFIGGTNSEEVAALPAGVAQLPCADDVTGSTHRVDPATGTVVPLEE